MRPAKPSPILSSARRDGVVFTIMLVALALGLSSLRVYYTATPYIVTLTAVKANDEAETLDLPSGLDGAHRKAVVLEKIRVFSESAEASDLTPPGGRLEWVLRYSKDSLQYDQERRVITNDLRGNAR